MDHLLVLLLLLWSSGLQTEGKHNSTESDDVRLVEGDSHCAGALEVKHQGEWRPGHGTDWSLRDAAVICGHLDCGSAVSLTWNKSSARPGWRIKSDCIQSGSALGDCAESSHPETTANLTCLDSVRLVNGSSLCSGRLEVKSNQSNQQWSSVCEDDFDQQDAEVVCRELGCGAPSVLQGALYGDVEAPVWSREFQCGGDESALLDCRSSDSARSSCSPGGAVGLTCSEPVEMRLLEGPSRCDGTLEVKHLGEWRAVYGSDWALKEAAAMCEHLDCGSAVSLEWRDAADRPVWLMGTDCVQSGPALRECLISSDSFFIFAVTCLDSVRLVNGSSLCSGRLEVKSNQSNQQWFSVCEDDFDQQDAEVVCRELGCGAPSVLQGALYGDVEAPVWSREFQCGGNESALLDCRSSDSARSSCSPSRAVGLTCSEPVEMKLLEGPSRCDGALGVKYLGEWRAVSHSDWTLKAAAVVCEHLDCGSAVSVGGMRLGRRVWSIRAECVQSGSALRECATPRHRSSKVDMFSCSESVRLVNGSSLCSGRLEVKSNQQWSSVCEDDFDQQDAEVVCRELGCGAPSVLQGALYGDVEAPVWSREFQCGGDESALLDCRSSDSARSSCSPSGAVGLTCSEPVEVKLLEGSSRCDGKLQVKHLQQWRAVDGSDWTLKEAAVVCEHLDCGSAVSLEWRHPAYGSTWRINPVCVRSGSPLRECATSSSSPIPSVTCSDSVRLVNGSSLCSGRLEVKSNQSNQSNQQWSSVCDDDFDQQDAEVVCRELGCGAPSVLQGALYGDVEAPVWSREFQCGGNESALLDCRSSDSARSSCSPSGAVGLTCSEPGDLRLVGGDSRCAGTLEMKHQGEWRKVYGSDWTLKATGVVCEHLDCGSAVSVRRVKSIRGDMWRIRPECVHSGSALRECATPSRPNYNYILVLICSELLVQPSISVSPVDRVSGTQQQGFQVQRGFKFHISCFARPQFPGGSFQLTSTSSTTAHSDQQPAVNHSAHFLFPAAEPGHQGSYSCVYHKHVFSHKFSSESRLLTVTVLDPTAFTNRVVVVSLALLVGIAALSFSCKPCRGLLPGRQETIEQTYYNLPAGDGGPTGEEGARGAEPSLQGAHLTST